MTENWLAGFANYESWIGDSENEGSPDLDRVFADAHDFQMARAAEAAQVSASNPPTPRQDPAITGPEDAPTPERAPTVPEPNENALTASLSSLAVRVSRHADRYSMPVPRSRYSDMRCPIQQARACMRHDLCDDGTTRTDTRPPSPTNANNNNFEIETHPRQPGDANDWKEATDTGSVSHAANASEAPGRECSENIDDAETQERVHAEDDHQGLVATNALTMRQWPFPQVAARRNDDDPIEEWGRDSERATPRDDQPMPKAARRGKAWVGTEAPLGTPIQGRSAQAASSTTNTKRTQAPAETRAVETGPGREMLSTVEKPG